jgi:hypothetical protein
MAKAKREQKTCPICGWVIVAADGACYRTELHWTPESLAAEDAERRKRQMAVAR